MVKGVNKEIINLITKDLDLKVVGLKRTYEPGYYKNKEEIKSEFITIQKSRIYDDTFQIVTGCNENRISLLNINREDLLILRSLIDEIIE